MTPATEGALRVERREDGVAILFLDVPGEEVNVIKLELREEFIPLMEELEADASVQALVIASSKPDNFLAGADLHTLAELSTVEEAAELSRSAQQLMNRVAEFRAPVVAAIHGACLGGGLELALACHARVASNHNKTKLGMPEVQLGLLPGAGGTQRLPALVGVQAALDLLLTGKQLNGKRALKIGLVDEVVPAGLLLQVAARRALALAEEPGPGWGTRLREAFTSEKLTELGLERNPLGRQVVFGKARGTVLTKTHGNYPAPEKILQVVRQGLGSGQAAGLEAEALAFGELSQTPQAKQLMSIYFATQGLKHDRGTEEEVEPRPVSRIGVLGAGLMGCGVAYVSSVFAGVQVRLKDRDSESAGRGLRALRRQLDERVARRRMSALERDRHMSRVTATSDMSGMLTTPVVIEAVFEDLQLKRRVLREVEEACPPDTIFASNTSSLPIADIASVSSHPETVIGMHYFSPVEKMPLLEIIVTSHTAPWVVATCVELGKRQGKTVIVVRDGAGFYTTRILGPYMNEAAFLLAQGVPIERIDQDLVEFGFPVGPIMLLDEVGIDVGEKVSRILHKAFGERLAPPGELSRLIEAERLGRKNQCGFYLYDDNRRKGSPKQVDSEVYRLLQVEPKTEIPGDEIAWRCTLQLVNEAVRCFEEGILRSARDGDIGAVFGLGFPPFRGGPFRLVDTLGARDVVDRLKHFQSSHGSRFQPARLLEEMADRAQSFYGEDAVEPRRPGA